MQQFNGNAMATIFLPIPIVEGTWTFDGGLVAPASSAPDVVPPPQSVTENVDPEEAFIANSVTSEIKIEID